MKVLSSESTGASVRFSLEELDALRNALNETLLLLKGREGADFQTRVGMTIDDAGVLVKALQSLIGDIGEMNGQADVLTFQAALEGRRGAICTVLTADGPIRVGDQVKVVVPASQVAGCAVS